MSHWASRLVHDVLLVNTKHAFIIWFFFWVLLFSIITLKERSLIMPHELLALINKKNREKKDKTNIIE